MTFSSREKAGRELGQHLLDRSVTADIVLGLPRGGVVVAAEVARILQCPLEILAVRKLGHPRQREFAVGALAEPDVVLLDNRVVQESRVVSEDLQKVIAEESERLRNYQAKFHRSERIALGGRIGLIVDDGLATGATVEAAVASARKQGARKVIVAAPVASSHAMERLTDVADEVIAVVVDPEFTAVGRYYDFFPQTTDEEVLALIHTHA